MIDPNVHPVKTTNYVVSTPSVERLVDHVVDWVETHTTGAMIIGRQRFGKSAASRFVRSFLAVKFPKVFSFILLCNEYDNLTERTFWGDILQDSGHSLPNSGTAEVRRRRLIDYLYAQAEELGDNRVVIFADDAQRLCERRYKWLMDLHNALDKMGVNLIVLLMGQPELVSMRTALSKSSKKQIVGRFMCGSSTFKGVCNAKEVVRTLSSYDEGSEWPAGSGITFTRHYYPQAWAANWRLSHLGELIWKAFAEVHVKATTGKSLREIPMQFLALVTEFILHGYGPEKDGPQAPEITPLMLKLAIERAGYPNFVRFDQ